MRKNLVKLEKEQIHELCQTLTVLSETVLLMREGTGKTVYRKRINEKLNEIARITNAKEPEKHILQGTLNFDNEGYPEVDGLCLNVWFERVGARIIRVEILETE